MVALRIPTASLALAIVLGSSGCSDAPSDADHGVVYDTIAGVEHVVSSGGGAWVETGGAWAIDEAGGVTIGAFEGADEYVFGVISGVAVDAEGRIHVADPQAMEIRVFSLEGAFLRRVGRDGEGPGEFRHISGLAVAPGGIAALDGGLGRVTVLGPSGEVVRMFRLERPYMILEYHAPMAFDPAGRFFDRARLSHRPGIDSIGVVSYDAAGAAADTAFLAEIQQDHVMIQRNGMPYMSFPRPFAPQPSVAFGPAGTAYLARGGEYRIDVFSPAGDSLRVIRRVVEPRPVSDLERDSAMTLIAERYEMAGATPPSGIELPQRKAVIARLVVDAGGNLWVLNQPDAGASGFDWSVHDPAGRYLGDIATPVMAVTQIGDDFVAGTVRGELDVPSAVVLPIRKGQR